MDQGRQTGHALDKAVVPSVPGERGTAATERAGLQPGQLVAAARTAEQDQELVADELATQVDEDRRSAGQARAVLLAAAGRRAFEPQAVRRHAAQDLGAAAAKRVALTGRGSTVFGSKRFRKEQCRRERRSARSINVCERMDEPWRLPAEVMCRVQREKTWYSGQRGVYTFTVPGAKMEILDEGFGGIVPERKVKITLPNQGPLDGFEVPITESTERWTELHLEDGSILRIKPIVLSVIRVDGNYDQDGNPIYAAKNAPQAMVIVSVPEHLRKPQDKQPSRSKVH